MNSKISYKHFACAHVRKRYSFVFSWSMYNALKGNEEHIECWGEPMFVFVFTVTSPTVHRNRFPNHFRYQLPPACFSMDMMMNSFHRSMASLFFFIFQTISFFFIFQTSYFVVRFDTFVEYFVRQLNVPFGPCRDFNVDLHGIVFLGLSNLSFGIAFSQQKLRVNLELCVLFCHILRESFFFRHPCQFSKNN